ncbi:MAG: ABC transporter permease, partial [Fulvivirga sp.]|nr:ABC transporter permease [Fulvivirga sp.]
MSQATPPKRITRLLEWICPDYLFEGIIGDLEEQFYFDVEAVGHKKARTRYWWNAIRFIRPEIILRNKFKLKIINNMMLNNYLKITGRNMAKRKMFSFINAFGLSIGIAFCILIYLFIQDEKRFDQFHENKAHIYRLESKSYDTWNPDAEEPFSYMAYLQTGLAQALIEEVPQVKYATRYNADMNAIVANEYKVFTESITLVDSSFFKMFSFPVLKGNSKQFLKDQHEVVLTPEIAEKYFGTQDVLGKTLQIEIEEPKAYTVVGIIEAPPAHSSLQFDILMDQRNRHYYERALENWRNFSTPTFVQLHDQADLTQFEANLDKIVDKYMAENLEKRREKYSVPENIDLFDYNYTNLSDMHLETQVTWSNSSDPQYAYILGGIAILILIIACINYISLSLTTSAARKTEVGIRKAVGAHKNQIIQQFAFESVLLAFVSMIIGLGLVVVFIPYFNEFTEKQITLTLMGMLQLVGIGFVLSLLIGLLAGSYPAFFLSNFMPSQVLKGGFSAKLKAGFTKPLVVLQFALSAFLIISSVIMYRQMEYVTTKDLGYDQEQVVVVKTQLGWTDESNRLVQQMRNELRTTPYIEDIAGTSISFNQGWSKYGYTIDGENKSAFVYAVDPVYVDLLNIELLEGRNFNPEISSDSNAVIVNEALVEDMGWDEPLQEYLNWQEDTVGPGAKVLGVAKNYHFRSLEQKIEPMFLTMHKDAGYLTNMLIKTKAGELSKAVEKIESTFHQLQPDKPFDYTFLDEDVAKQYAAYQRWMNIMGLATFFAIIISCLGLFGLAGI